MAQRKKYVSWSWSFTSNKVYLTSSSIQGEKKKQKKTQHPKNQRMAWVGRDLKDHEDPTPPATGRATNLHI